MGLSKKQLAWIILIGGLLVWITWLFGEILWSPNAWFFSLGGDGPKHYFSTEWYVRWGKGSWSMATGYPFGNHLIYTDQNPALSVFLGFWEAYFFPVGEWTRGWINLLMIVGILPAGIFGYLILRKSLLPPVWAAVFALVITILNPQIMRMTGHFSMAVICFFPGAWYGLIKADEWGGKWYHYLPFAGWSLLFTFFHPYHGLVALTFGGLWLFIRFLQNDRRRRNFLQSVLVPGFLFTLPLLILKGWESTTSPPHPPFVQNPSGLALYHAGFESVFLPTHGPYFDWLSSWIDIEGVSPEGYGYVGITGFAILLFLLFRVGRLLFKKRGIQILKPVLPTPLRPAIWAAFLILIPAMAIPLNWEPSWEPYFAPLSVFRSLGRLIWAFYGVYMVFCAVLIYQFYRLLRKKGNRFLALTTVVVALGLWGIEANWMVTPVRTEIHKWPAANHPFLGVDYRAMLAEKGFSPQDFQAVIALPYYHEGSQKLHRMDWQARLVSLPLAQNLGLPLVNNASARSPVAWGLAQVQLVSHPLIEKKLIHHMPDNRPLLLVWVDEPLTIGEQLLVERSQPIFSYKKMRVARLRLEDFDDRRQEQLASWDTLKTQTTLMAAREGWTPDGDPIPLWETFGDAPDFLGGACLRSQPRHLVVWDGVLESLNEPADIEVSYWQYCGIEAAELGIVRVTVNDQLRHTQKATETVDVCGNWARISLSLRQYQPGDRLRIFTTGFDLAVDNLLIRKKNQDFWVETPDGSVLYNNYWLQGPWLDSLDREERLNFSVPTH